MGGLTWGVVKFLDAPLKARQTEEWMHRDFAEPAGGEAAPAVRADRHQRDDRRRGEGRRVPRRQFKAAGIPYRIEQVGPRKANLYAWLVGKDSRPLVLHNHIDVSAVDPKEWFSPPFEARIQLPWIYGRGVFDMKSVAIAQMLAMIDLKKSGVPLAHSVLFLGTSSEERGSRLGIRRIIQLHPEMVRNFWAVLDRGRGGRGADARRDQVLGDRVRPEALRRPDRLRRRPPARWRTCARRSRRSARR